MNFIVFGKLIKYCIDFFCKSTIAQLSCAAEGDVYAVSSSKALTLHG